MSETDYNIGFGKPPKKTRFTKGKSGNPKGRPKGSKDFASDLRDVLDAKVAVTENGTLRKVTSQKATLMRLREQALKGDARAMKQLLDLAKEQAVEDWSRKAERGLTASEGDILERFTEDKLKARGGDAPKDKPLRQDTGEDPDEQQS